MDTSKYNAYSDLTNTFNMNTDTVNSTTITTTDISVAGTLTLSNIATNKILSTDISNNVIGKSLSGTTNQVIVDNSTNIVLSLPQAIATTSNVQFNNLVVNDVSLNNVDVSGYIAFSSLGVSDMLGLDSNKKLVNKSVTGVSNQINVSSSLAGITLSTPQDISTISNVTFNNITSNGTITNSTLATNSIVATDGAKALINRTLAGTSNQININTVGTTTTFSTPQNIHTGATPRFVGVTVNSLESSGNTLNIASSNTTQNINIGSGTGLQTVNIGSSGSGTTTINIGAGGDIVNIGGALNYITTNNLDISDNIITINKGSSGSGTARGAGINIRDASNDNQGYITVGNTGNTFTLKAPENNFVLSTPVLTANSTIVTTNEIQSIGGVKTFTANPIINPGVGVNGELFIRGNNESGFSLFSVNNATGLQVWSTSLSSSILNLRNSLTASRLLTTDSNNYLASASIGTSDLVLTSGNQTIAGNKTLSGSINLSSLTASMYLGLDSSKNIVSLSNPSISLLSSNNTWTGTNTFSNSVNLSAQTASKFLTLDAGKNIVSTTVDPVLVSGNQTVGGIKTFTSAPFVDSAGSAYVRLRITGQSGFDLYTFGDSTGFGVWSVSGGGPILQLRNTLTASRLLTTDTNNYLASASIGTSDLVLTSGNQTVAGEKTFSSGIRLPTVGGTASLLDFYESWNSTVTFSGPFTSNPTMNVFVVRVGRSVTISLEGCLGTSPAFGTGNTASSTTNIIPARFLGGTKCFGTFKGYNGPGTTVVAVFMIVLSTGQIQVQLVSGNWGTSVNTGWDAMTGSNVI